MYCKLLINQEGKENQNYGPIFAYIKKMINVIKYHNIKNIERCFYYQA